MFSVILVIRNLTVNEAHGPMSWIEVLQPFYLGNCMSRGEGYLGEVT